jgi:hypothetical protein
MSGPPRITGDPGATRPDPAPGEGSADDGAAEAAGPARPTRKRHIWVNVLIWATSVLAVIGILAVWANRQMLSPENWSRTSTKLLQSPVVREATANYLVDQLYQNVNVEQELKSRLPAQLQPLAGPVAGAIRNLATEAAQRALANARVQEAWRQANRAADQTLVTVIEGGNGVLLINHGEVTLNLASIVHSITERLGLPNVSSKLPANVAQLRVLRSSQISAVQEGGKALKGLALLFTILVPLLYALAILLARGFRRRTLMNVGIAFVGVGVVVFLARTILINQLTDALVKTEAARPAAHEVLSIATSLLRDIAGGFIFIGVPLIAAAWFAGPARIATRGREAIAPFLREHAGWTYGIVAAIMVLIFIWNPIPATGKPAGIIVFLALAFLGTYVLRRQTAEEFPSGSPPAAPATTG